jgi:hypothetical protein
MVPQPRRATQAGRSAEIALPVSAAVDKPYPARLAFLFIPLVRLSETVAPRWVCGAVVTKRPERERQDCKDDSDAEPTPDVHDKMIVQGSPQAGVPMRRRSLWGGIPEAPTHALVLELRTRRPGGFRVDAVTVSYRGGGRSYPAPFATIAIAPSAKHRR